MEPQLRNSAPSPVRMTKARHIQTSRSTERTGEVVSSWKAAAQGPDNEPVTAQAQARHLRRWR